MNMVDIIYKKREGQVLTKEEIDYFVTGYTDGNIPDYQAAALLMAIYFRGMNKEETYELTRAMKYSGDTVDLSRIKGIKVDKHSTGGVGDKTTLIVGPLAAACGVPIAKMSGRGLGFTGGTVDKMEAIPGFRTTVDAEDFIHLVNDIGLSVIGQTSHIAPADKKIYALRDVTATVDNLSLITSSIMSKKLASGSDAIVLDVKCGNGAFMESMEEAVELGELMVEIGKADGKKTIAVITDMNQPLGYAVGNSLEVMEAIDTLKGKGPADITELSLVLAGYMIYAGEKASTYEEGYKMAEEALESGSALKKLAGFIEGQGGDPLVTENYLLFPQPTCHQDVIADRDGYIGEIEAKAIGLASQHSGAGRAKKEDQIDLSAGILLLKKVGDTVKTGDILATVYGRDSEKVMKGAEEAGRAFEVVEDRPEKEALIKKIIK
ncbi:pyrimidine-nucleoside phosphorylase [Sinanaerobacter chloroacetimidivorans]|jgi:pyrimidine-nucleoside phosphorylase|uniref:Pyrimidine-nucleoside phosphorylase n=1 Tax=Sinanaerobacter chloroacetimidivorans TaxID=2818044 RepID=A0A8J7W6I5_9FIRM|nr:pyrimidine-nucleoside phosphorylase [Sinanaerobacter chloroacetimidivorans]MBR0600003.1 pyrimidine-nucleoside phosphorylase [Sinanaerobacter chloroacetimidivorans]